MLRSTLAVLILAAAPLPAQWPPVDVAEGSPEGRLLSSAYLESKPARKIELLELFLHDFPAHRGCLSVYTILLPHYLAAAEHDKVWRGAEHALSLDPTVSHLAYQALQSCEATKNLACIKTWAARTVAAAQRMLAVPKPSEGPNLEAWKKEQDYAAQVIQRADYSLYAMGLQATDAATVVDMYDTLRARNESSPYLAELGARCFAVLQTTKQTQAALRVAETEHRAGRATDEMLIVVAQSALQTKDFAASATLALKAKERLAAAAPPAGADAAAWEKHRRTSLGIALWIAGNAFGATERWWECDRALRESLPYLGANYDLLPAAYFYLGVANFRLSQGPKGDKTRMADARRFTSLCVGMNSPYQALAQNNLISMGKETVTLKPPKW